jgi:hypothetical protein
MPTYSIVQNIINSLSGSGLNSFNYNNTLSNALSNYLAGLNINTNQNNIPCVGDSILESLYPKDSLLTQFNVGYNILSTDCIDSNLFLYQLLQLSENKYQNSDIVTGGIGYPTNVDTNTGTFIDFLGQAFNINTNLFSINFKSPLDEEANKARFFQFQERVKFNTISETFGQLNLNPLSLITGNPIIQKDYRITKFNTAVGNLTDALSEVFGFKLPVSPIPGSRDNANDRRILFSQPFNTDNGNFQYTSLGLLDYTTDATKSLLFRLIDENKYKPKTSLESENKNYLSTDTETDNFGLGYFDDNFNDNYVKDQNGVFSTNDFSIIPESGDLNSFVISLAVNNANITGNKSNKFTWEKSNNTSNPFNERSILHKTQQLINNQSTLENSDNPTQNPIGRKNDKTFPNSSRVKTLSGGTYCRNWSPKKQYRTYGDTIRNSELFSYTDNSLSDFSVLEKSGMPKITPYATITDNSITEKINTQKATQKYMFSIENLAWKDNTINLPECEKGVNKGRIMWFPPYDINFSESSSVQYDKTQFIGRPEPIYTYNTSERTGTLKFKLIVDHSAYAHHLSRKQSEEELWRHYLGCEDLKLSVLSEIYSEVEKSKLENLRNTQKPKPVSLPEPAKPPFEKLTFYFPDSVGEFNLGYQEAIGSNPIYSEFNNTEDFATQPKVDQLVNFLLTQDGKQYKIKITGFASARKFNPNTPNSNFKDNQGISKFRAENIKQYIYLALRADEEGKDGVDVPISTPDNSKFKTEGDLKDEKNRWDVSGKGVATGNNDPVDNPIENPTAVRNRRTEVVLEYNPKLLTDIINKEEINQNTEQGLTLDERIKEQEKIVKSKANYFDECNYFDALSKKDSFIYQEMKEKLRYFTPAFHSMTPQGFNKRLTFLQQCTRPGPSVNKTDSFNAAFGRPPVCVLRIGDFYNTKIIVNSVNFTYEPLVWDLNPEGNGVQPMICNVDISFNFIGGSSIQEPINKLQNALSENFYANTSFYSEKSYSSNNETRKEEEKEKEKAKEENKPETVTQE